MEVALISENSFDGSICPINSIPDEILLQIFKKLKSEENHKRSIFKSISRVSKRWNVIADETQTSLTLSGFKASGIKQILERFNHLNTLNLSLLYDCSDEALFQVGKNCPNLGEIQISNSYKPSGGGHGLVSLAMGCPRLQVLAMHGYEGPDAPLMAIGNHCLQLRQLQLRSSPTMSDSVMVNIASSCHKIEMLDVSFTNITDQSLRAIGQGMPMLKHLDMKHCKNVTGDGIRPLVQGCLRLQVLHLGVVDVGENGLAAIGQHSKQLSELYLDYGWGKFGKLSRDAIAQVAMGCSNLRILSLRGSKQVDDKILQGLALGCPSLTTLDLHACDKVSDEGLQAIVKGCQQLENLVLSGTSVGSIGGLSINGKLLKLKSLRLNGEFITDEFLQSISINCKALSELHLASCVNITDGGLAYVMTGCKQLKALTIKHATIIDGSAFSVPVVSLESLNMQGSTIADQGLVYVAENCGSLSRLSLQDCLNLSPDVIKSAMLRCVHLKELNLVGCTQLTREHLLAIVKASNPALKTMRVSRPDSPQDEYTISNRYGGWNLPNWARCASPSRMQLS